VKLSDVEAELRAMPEIRRTFMRLSAREIDAIVRRVRDMIVQRTYEEEHRHKASCHGATGEYMCGY